MWGVVYSADEPIRHSWESEIALYLRFMGGNGGPSTITLSHPCFRVKDSLVACAIPRLKGAVQGINGS